MIQKIQNSAFLVLLLIFGMGCSQDDAGEIGTEPIPVPQKKQFIVDKIYDYNDELLGEYFYNGNNQLIKRTVYSPVAYPGIKVADNELTYTDGKITNISFIDYTHPEFNHDIKVFYDSEGKISADETIQFGRKISRRDYLYFPNGQLRSFVSEGQMENFFFNYKNTQNALEVKVLHLDDDSVVINAMDKYIENFRNFVYDDKSKPDFGIGNIFQFEPMPLYGDEAQLEKNISKNNLIEFVNGTQWKHTYNEQNLPETIDVKWKDVEVSTPMVFKIKYKEVIK